ncbi:hypothetical protein ACGFNF_02640 [Micromonospora sp. NPDC048868]|uniref:hypothetical protein n=1 Tax=Micromonospora sp. NPDC048868 TaxID=3364258 RepID=UPI00371EEF32
MVWLTYRQHRAQLLVTFGALILLGGTLLVSALEATSWAAGHAPDGCPGSSPVCHDFNRGMFDRYHAVYQVFGYLPLVGPALIGAFWGAPLVAREMERGTFRMAWTQSVTTLRWILAKLGLLCVAVVVAGAALAVMVGRWNAVFEGAFPDSSFTNPGKFNIVGLAPAAWWLFAFAVGAATSAILRRTVPAMAVTVAVIAVAIPAVIVSHDLYAKPDRQVGVSRDALIANGDVIVAEMRVAPDGRVSDGSLSSVCPPAAGVDPSSSRAELAEQDCLLAKGYQAAFDVHPASRFWLFQSLQALLLVGGAVVLLVVTVRRTLRLH